jgi:hypothetical protein
MPELVAGAVNAAATGRRLRSAISVAITAMALLSVAPRWLGDQGREWPPSTSYRHPYLRSTTYPSQMRISGGCLRDLVIGCYWRCYGLAYLAAAALAAGQ